MSLLRIADHHGWPHWLLSIELLAAAAIIGICCS